MRAFVTGGTGFVGSHLVDLLLRSGVEVRCLVRNPAKAERIFGAQQPNVVRGDLEHTAALEEGCDEATVVFHVAGLVAARSNREFHQVNVEATSRVIRAAQRTGASGVRFVYVSSLAAGGPVARGEILRDPDAQSPVTDYGRSKLEGEKLVRRSEIDWTVVRPPAVYGPRDTEMYKVFKLARSGIAPLFGDGLQELSLVHGEDLAAALVAAAEPQCSGKAYYAAHPEVITASELATRIYRAVKMEDKESQKRPRIIKIPGAVARAVLQVTGALAKATRNATILSPDKAAEFLAPAWTCDPGPLTADTGWAAKYDSASGAGQTARWYRDNSWL